MNMYLMFTFYYSLFYQPRKADFIVLYSGQIMIRLPLVYFLNLQALTYYTHWQKVWEFTNATLRFLPSILHPLLKSLEALILLAFCELFIKLLSKICAKILIKIQQELIFVHFIQTIQHLSSVFLTFIIKNTTIIFWLNSKRSLNQPIYSNNISYFYLT